MRNTFPHPAAYDAQPRTVRWWIPLVASTGALLVLVTGSAAMVSTIVNAAISSMG